MSKLLLEDDPRSQKCSKHDWVVVENKPEVKVMTCANCGETRHVDVKESAGGGKRFLFG